MSLKKIKKLNIKNLNIKFNIKLKIKNQKRFEK